MKKLLIAAALTLLMSATGASAQTTQTATADDRRAVLAVVDALFAAMLARDGAAVTPLVEPQGIVTSVSTAPDGSRRVTVAPWADFAAGLARAPAPIRERLFSPEVRVHGDIAMVWSRYDLWIGDTFSHCGTDLFDLVRRDGQWRMLNVTYTRERTGCETRRPPGSALPGG